MKLLFRSVVFIVALLAMNVLHAQLTNVDLSTIESGILLSPGQLPLIGNYFSAANPSAGPLPGNLFGLWGWSLGGEDYLMDDLPGAPSGGGFQAMDDSGPPFPGDGGTNNDFDSFTDTASIPTNGLWLWITNAADGMLYANLNGATDYVYEIYSTTYLATAAPAVTNWGIETVVFPDTNATTTPFSTYLYGRPNLFLWARDWTGVTSNGNTTPDWWFYYWFGVGGLGLLDTNMDVFGNTLLSDYINTTDPDYITYSLQYTNNYYTANPAGMTISLQTGIPVYEAVLINDTNSADAVWQPFTSTNLTLDLSNGLCSVYVGLRGRPPEAQVTWRLAELTLNDTLLTLTVINPASDTVLQPMIQVQGYASKPLASLTFDVSNASGVFTNQTGYVVSQYADTNLQMFTTNYFQCYDVRMAEGANLITLHAMDTGGNSTETSVSYTLDYSANTNPPVLSIIWPPDGTMISGTNLSLQAQVDDDTATVTAQITDASGDTNTVQGLVERSGLIWANNLPLAAGTNFLTVTATDAGGYSATTNLTVVQSAVTVTVDPLPGNQLNQSSVTVTGTVSDTNETVYVNGVTATVHADGTWTACMVPASSTGTATFNVQAYSSDSTLDGSQASSQPQPPALVLMSYQMQTGHSSEGTGANQSIQWDYLAGGDWGTRRYPTGNGSESGWSANDPDIPPDGTNYIPPVVTSDQGETFSPTWQISDENITEDGENLQTKTSTTLAIIPEDQEQPGDIATYLVEITCSEFSDLNNDENISGLNLGGANPGDLQDPPQWAQISGQSVVNSGITNDDGSLPGFVPVSGPSGVPLAMSVGFLQDYFNNDHTFNASVYRLISQCVATTPINQARTNLGVCEQVNLSFNPALPANVANNINWTTTAGSLALTAGTTNQFTAPDYATNVMVTAIVANTPINLYFQTYAPTGMFMQNVPGTFEASTNPLGIGYYTYWYIQPNNVSFYNVKITEGIGYSTATGYFYPSMNNLEHIPSEPLQGGVVVPGKGTSCQPGTDTVSSGTHGPPYSNGTWTWPIPYSYITPDGETNYFMTVNVQNVLTVTASNTVLTVQKQESGGSVMINN